MNNLVDILIRRYFGNQVSDHLRAKFGWWMTHSADTNNDKTEAMERLWDETEGHMDLETLKDLENLRSRISRKPQPVVSHPRRSYWWAAAASVLLVVATALFTRFYDRATQSVGDEFVQVSVPYGESRQLVLEDSTWVTVNAGSTLIYPRHFSKDKRNVFLLGEANFDVSKDARRPFTVETHAIHVTALGTRFGVTAYSEARTVSTTLAEGSTRVEILEVKGANAGKTYLLKPDQNLTYDKRSGEVTLREINAERKLSWEQGNLIFEGDDFKTILSSLEHRFGVVFVCEHIERMSGSYYVRFRSDETLDDALGIINNLSHHFEYQQQGDTVYIYPL